MPRGERRKRKKQDLLEEVADQLHIEVDSAWKSTGGTVTAASLESILFQVARQTGVPPTQLPDHEKDIWRLLYNSMEAMLLSLEIVNKPSITYRLESFLSVFLNSWELLLKARIIRSRGTCGSIKNRNQPNKTISFPSCLRKLFTVKHDPVRLNLERIEELRNEALHYHIPLVPPNAMLLFQAAVMNYEHLLNEWFNRSLTEKMPYGMMFLVSDIDPETLSLGSPVLRRQMNAEAFQFLQSWSCKVRNDLEVISEQDLGKYALPVKYELAFVRNPNKADIVAYLEKTPDTAEAQIVLKYQKTTDKYPLSYTELCKRIKGRQAATTAAQINRVIRENKIKDDANYSTYNFRNKTQEENYKSTGILPKSIPSIYTEKAVDFILRMLSEESTEPTDASVPSTEKALRP